MSISNDTDNSVSPLPITISTELETCESPNIETELLSPTISDTSDVPANQQQSTFSSNSKKRRSSTRSIKRKRFDDELVESSLYKNERVKLKTSLPDSNLKIENRPNIASPVLECSTSSIVQNQPIDRKKISKQSSKRSKKNRSHLNHVPLAGSTKDLGRWKPQDDLALIISVQHTSDLAIVHLGVKFSCRFTLKEIQERWYALLYDPILSKLATQALKQLHPDIISAIYSRIPFSKAEEHLLGSVLSNSQPSLSTFSELLQSNCEVFHRLRTSKSLYSHWLLMKQYHILSDQSVQPIPRGDHVLNFSDAEDLLRHESLRDNADLNKERELSFADRSQKQEIKHLENELPRWQVLVDSVTGIGTPDFDPQTLAVLRGRLVRYLMRSREIILGRSTASKENQVDIDLSLEGPAWKVSRRQGVIKLRSSGDFYLGNEGKRPIYVDGKPVLHGSKHKLNNNSVVEISNLHFVFLINQELVKVIRNEAQKLIVS